MQDKCTAILVKCTPQITAGLCLCNHTYGDLHSIQVCSDAVAMQCSTGQVKIAPLLFVAALQTSLTACLCHCSYTYEDFALHTGEQ